MPLELSNIVKVLTFSHHFSKVTFKWQETKWSWQKSLNGIFHQRQTVTLATDCRVRLRGFVQAF